MSGTTGLSQTISYLLGNEFQDGQSAGSITPRYIRDIVATIKIRTPVYRVTDPEFGAIGDGSSHPLSSVTSFQGKSTSGWSLTQWQTIFSFATATSNELDWCAHQLAINTAHANAAGGTVHSPAGLYRMSGTLTFPETDTVDSSTMPQGVNWIGDGSSVSVMYWSADLGTGAFAVTCTNRLNTTTGSVGIWQDLGFIGPGTTFTLGVKPCNMHGLGWAEYRKCKRITISRFNGGICVNSGGQTHLDEVEISNCYYGMYCDAPNATPDGGDMVFTRLAINSCTLACIGVANSTQIIESIFMKCGFFASPIGIYKETGGSENNILLDCIFVSAQFEQIGNAIITDGLASGAHVATLNGTNRFDSLEYIPNSSFSYGSLPVTGLFCLYQTFGPLIIENPSIIGNWTFTGTTNGIFEIDFPSAGIILRGDLDTLFANLVSAGKPIGKGNWNSGIFRLENTGANSWEGRVFPANGAPAISVGSVLALDASGNSTVGLSSGNTTEQIAGICVLTNAGVSGGPVGVAQKGYIPVVNSGSTAITNGSWARAGASGLAVASTGLFQTSSKNLGVWGNAAGTGSAHTGSLFLQGIT